LSTDVTISEFAGCPPAQADDSHDTSRPRMRSSKAGEGIRTPDVQLGKLAFYH
jgi:hypothetical protein